MFKINGNWYDGKSSNRLDVWLIVDLGNAIRIETVADGTIVFQQKVFQARISDRLAATPRILTFPEGAVFETIDHDMVDQILARMDHRHWSQWVHQLESKWLYVLVACIMVVLITTGAVKYGVPFTARVIAERLPANIYQIADRQTLRMLDRIVFSPSELDQQIDERIRLRLQQVMDDYPSLPLRLELRKGGKLGPNAFALPGGTIVFTDEMVEIAEHDVELVSVMVHEIGHVHHHHGMRRMVQDSLVSFLLIAVTGDASGVSELFLGLPVILTELAYSREFEREADRFALSYLEEAGIPTIHFADMLTRIEEKHQEQRETEEKRWTGYLSTHPSTDERVRAFRNSSERPQLSPPDAL